MNHEEIVTAARDRIAEIDSQIADLAAERAKLQAMVNGNDKMIGSAIIEEALRQLQQQRQDQQPVPLTWPVHIQPFYPYQPQLPWGTDITICGTSTDDLHSVITTSLTNNTRIVGPTNLT